MAFKRAFVRRTSCRRRRRSLEFLLLRMPSKSKLWAVAAMAVALVCIFVAMKIADYAGGLDLVNAWTKDVGVLGMVLFALLSGMSVVFFFPGSILMTASGAAFGLRDGFVVALVATSVGAALAFLASRYLARKRVEEWVASKPRFAAVDNAIGHEGWKIVVLTRCCPLFPYIFQNYAYGLTRVGFGHYALGSLLGLIPSTLVFVYMGSLGAEAAVGATSSLELGLRVLGFVATVVVSIYITRISTRALEQAGL